MICVECISNEHKHLRVHSILSDAVYTASSRTKTRTTLIPPTLRLFRTFDGQQPEQSPNRPVFQGGRYAHSERSLRGK
jgi:hypothetical protein